MIGRSERLLKSRSTIPADSHEAVSKALALLALNALKPLANRQLYGSRQALPSEPSQLLGEPTCLIILNVWAHVSIVIA